MSERKECEIPFVGLHAHSTFSAFDGFGYPDEHQEFAYGNGMDALALTDHGTMNGLSYAILNAQKMNAEGKKFKAILGVEAYFLPDVVEWREKYEQLKEDKKAARQLKSAESSGNAVETDGSAAASTVGDLPRYRHLILLAQNQTGLSNLYRIVSESHDEEHFYRRPRTDFALLRKYSEGVICSSACMSGPLAGLWWQHREEGDDAVQAAMTEYIREFVDIFGDRFYGEIQWNAIPEQHEINKHIIQACLREGVKIISTADSHYPRQDAWKDREMYKRLGWLSKGTPSWITEDKLKMPESVEEIGYELYPKNGQQMWDAYKSYSEKCEVEYDDDLVMESITLTHWIAHEQIEEFQPDTTIQLPDFVVPEGDTADSALAKQAVAGLKAKRLTSEEYVERLKYELDVISTQGFSKYFLTMKAIADKANEMMATGVARGSASGSLLAYVLNITQIDPIRFGLPFERFMTRDMRGMPDIDFDVAEPALLKETLAEDWGEFSVIPISNWNTLQLKSLIKDISKFYKLPFQEVNEVTGKMMLEATPAAKKAHGIKAGVYVPTFEEVMEYSPTLQSFLGKHPHIKTHVEAIYGNIRANSRHAGGCLIADNLNERMPLIRTRGIWQTPWAEGQNVRHLEPLGFIKFDILGLSTLTMIQEAISHVLKRHHGVENPTIEEVNEYYSKHLHPDVIDLDDKAVWENVFHNVDDAPGVFQFAESGMRSFCEQAKPNNLTELSAVTSLFRPGPLSMKTDQAFVEAKNAPHLVTYEHPILKEVLEKTYGLIIFQEDIANIVHKIGKDISLTEGNKLRKLLTKKGGGDSAKAKNAIHVKYIEGAKEKGIPVNVANSIWDKMEAFAAYGFSLNHATAYSLISYQCAWLFQNYPVEWMAAFLQKEPEKRKEKAIMLAKKAGFEIRKLDVNTSGRVWEISPDGKTLIQPLTAIKGLGDAAIDQILANRPFERVEDFLFNENMVYSKLNKKALDVLIRAGALNCLVDGRFSGLKHFWSAVAVERPRKLKNLEENIELYRPEGDFDDEQMIQYSVDLTGVFPMSDVMSEEIRDKLESRFIPPLGEYDEDLKLAWFIPRKIVPRKTKNNKDYWIVEAIDDTGTLTKIKCWGVNSRTDIIYVNKPYLGKLDYHPVWGFSTRSIRHNFRLLG